MVQLFDFDRLATLIELKLTGRRRFKDLAEVIDLIRNHNLDETFQEKLHPSAHYDYLKCLEAKRREDEDERTQDETFEQMMRSKSQPQPPPS